jgi:hypothetical protein
LDSNPIYVHHRRPFLGQILANGSVGSRSPLGSYLHAIRLELNVRVFILRVEDIQHAFGVDAQATPS